MAPAASPRDSLEGWAKPLGPEMGGKEEPLWDQEQKGPDNERGVRRRELALGGRDREGGGHKGQRGERGEGVKRGQRRPGM